jgi:hypothetical protein
MRIVLKVSSSNKHYDGGCGFALVDLIPELAALALQRIAALREQKTVDPNIDETSYWAYFVACYFSPYAGLAIDDQEVEGTCIASGDMLDNLQIEEKEVVTVPECFQVPSSQIAAVECEKMVVRSSSIAFTAIPKHASFRVHTVEIPLPMLEAALAISPSATQA